MYHVLLLLLLLQARVAPLPHLCDLLLVFALFRCRCLQIESDTLNFKFHNYTRKTSVSLKNGVGVSTFGLSDSSFKVKKLNLCHMIVGGYE